MLCVSSDHSTIHLFSLQKPLKRSNSKKLENYIKGDVSFSRFHIQATSSKNKLPAVVSKCAFSSDPNSIVGQFLLRIFATNLCPETERSSEPSSFSGVHGRKLLQVPLRQREGSVHSPNVLPLPRDGKLTG
uniref:WD_REPEATS_REGION domain-containing protein n=1 Tax=Steinernema glaseri TaxID=37863 RepID=A0A1I8A3Z7_9BILA